MFFTVNGSGAPVDGAIGAHLPPGARYVPGSTALSGGPGIAAGEPTLAPPENELSWPVTGIELGTPYELTFQAKPGLSLGIERARAKVDADGLDGTVNSPTSAATAINEPGEPGNGDPGAERRRSSPTRSISATRRAAPTGTTSRCTPMRASS